MNRRFYVEQNPKRVTEASVLLKELTSTLHTETLKSLRLINVYDFYKLDEAFISAAQGAIANGDDQIFNDEELEQLLQNPHFCIESLPGQFDQRADILKATLLVSGISDETQCSTAKLYLFNKELSDDEFEKIQTYLFNPIDTRLKDLNKPVNSARFEDRRRADAVPEIRDFIHMTPSKLTEFKLARGLAMEFADLEHIQRYFKEVEGRNPTETEILVLDTYWSDHCRHTTFETELLKIDFNASQFHDQLQSAYENYLTLREKSNITDRPETLMDMGTIFGRYQRKSGELADMEVSDEVNACSIYIDVDVDGELESWLLMFKNETHNHPTEIEPFGGASTCVGGAIRDPLSGRAYVYQAMRISGAADVLEPMEETLEGKLPQRKITKTAALGNSAYANQIGAATSFAKEFYHPGFVAKRMEVGAVVGAVPASQVVRQAPKAGDIIIMLGGRTGRDGVGGATGSSQVQTVETIDTAGSEVQKGSPIEERKILRLFRKPHVTKMIKKSNDFGAGGVSVAIGELADGVEINLDVVPVKYAGLNGTELAISESQERMAVVVDAADADRFIAEAMAESVEAVKVATVTDTPRLVIRWQGEKIVDIARAFLDTNGIRKSVEVKVVDSNLPSPLMMRKNLEDITKTWQETLAEYNNASQKGMQMLFDATHGRSTVLAPYGGAYQLTPAEASVQKIQVERGFTNTATILAHGYNPYIGEWSPFHGAAYAVIESVGRVVAAGGDRNKIRFSFQEYFERLDNSPERFGKPVAALLGSIEAQRAFNVPSIGGKDSMSGSFNDIHVPPTLISFAVAAVTTDRVLSPEFKSEGDHLYLLPVKERGDSKIDYDAIIRNYDTFTELREHHPINGAISVRQGGVAKGIALMAFGNRLGLQLEGITPHDLFRPQYGALLFTSSEALPDGEEYLYLGRVQAAYQVNYNEQIIDLNPLESAYLERFEPLFPLHYGVKEKALAPTITPKPLVIEPYPLNGVVKEPSVYIPIFPGTHSEYETAKAFEAAGAKVELIPFRTLNSGMIDDSISEMVNQLAKSDIFVLSSGFITTDEAAGAGSYIANILNKGVVKQAVEELIERGGLILGINAGFNALIKTGLLPLGRFEKTDEIGLYLNQEGDHRATLVETKVVNNHSPWFKNRKIGERQKVPFSTREGRLLITSTLAQKLIDQGQVATQYVDPNGDASMDLAYNPAGAYWAIEALTSPNGQILGKMAHSERYEEGLLLNIPGPKEDPIFEAAVTYFKQEG